MWTVWEKNSYMSSIIIRPANVHKTCSLDDCRVEPLQRISHKPDRFVSRTC